jgi:hypothetical protein
MIEKIDRLESKYERRKPVLLERDRGKERSLETMSRASANHSAKSSHGVACRFSIVWKLVQPSLNSRRSLERVDDAALGPRQRNGRRIDPGRIRETILHYFFFKSIVQISLCLSPIVK